MQKVSRFGEAATKLLDWKFKINKKTHHSWWARAGNGNRTRLSSLEGYRTTTMLCPHIKRTDFTLPRSAGQVSYHPLIPLSNHT